MIIYKSHKDDGTLAQLAEQLTLNQRVVGSSPTCPIHAKEDLQIANPLFFFEALSRLDSINSLILLFSIALDISSYFPLNFLLILSF